MADEEVPQVEPAAEVVADAPAPEPVVASEPEPTKAEKALASMQQRIDELTWKLRENERQKAKPEPVQAEQAAPPTLASFEYDEGKFQAAQAEYVRNEARRIAREELGKAKQESEVENKTQTFREREKAFAAKTPDYAEKVYNTGTVPISDAMADEIRESDLGAELAYYLANNRDVARHLYELPPRQVAREMGRLEAKLSAPKVVPVARVSQAPPPTPRVDSAGDAGVSVTPDTPESDTAWNADEWAKRRNKQLNRKKG